MKYLPHFALSPLLLAMSLSVQAQDKPGQQSADEQDIETLLITGVRQQRVSQGATGLTMDISETPQSISVISDELMQDFSAFNVNDALRLATGVTVEAWETNRTNYSSRGFEIKNTQIDGVGLPNDWGIVTGSVEAYGYDKIEVIRGANGLLTGVGNASGTLNYVRKRPTNETGGEIGASLGSYNMKRVQGDYNVLLTEDGRWAARVVGVAEGKESHLDGLENDLGYVYAVVDGQLTDYSTLTVGYSYQDAKTDGNTWGGLIFNYTDGTQAEWDDSATTTQDWTMWDTINRNAFIEYALQFSEDWRLNINYNRREFEEQDTLFYVYGSIDKDTGLGGLGWPARYDSEIDADLIEFKLTGFYELFGREHEATLGMSYAQSRDVMYNRAAASDAAAWGLTPAFPYALDAIPEPEWGAQTLYSDIEQNLSRYFGSTKLNATDDLFFIVGFNAIDFERSGDNAGTLIDNSESEVSPYVGATYKATDNINAYVSYSDIYQPQEQYNLAGEYLDPTKGKNLEAGLKAQWFDDRLLTTFALFTAEQENLATYAGINPDNGQYYYVGTNVESKGFEVEVTGQLTENLSVIMGYTHVEVEDESGADANTWAPQDYVNYTVNYVLPAAPALSMGLNGRWQSQTSNMDYNVTQDSYLLVNAYASYDFTEQLSARLNINNLTDEKYISSVHSSFFYAAPANAMVSVNYQF